jgi:hypothetical protein
MPGVEKCLSPVRRGDHQTASGYIEIKTGQGKNATPCLQFIDLNRLMQHVKDNWP